MSSPRKLLWGLGRVRVFALKKDPTKLSLKIHCEYLDGGRKGKEAGFHEIHKLPTRVIKAVIEELSNAYARGPWFDVDTLWHANCELALDYLFAELGRRANRKVIS